MNVATPAGTTGESRAARLDDFFQYLAGSNPFLSGQVSEAPADLDDVAAIHDRPSRDLIRLAQTALHERKGVGAVLWGEAGIGKSHLLARLSRWAGQCDAKGRENAVFVLLHNVQASPDRLPRYVLKCVLSRLTRGRRRALHGTPLYWLVVRFIKQALKENAPDTEIPTADQARFALLRQAARFVEAHPNVGEDAQSVFEVLYRFFLGAYRRRRLDGDEREARLAVRWLAGEELDAEELDALGLRSGEYAEAPRSLADEQTIHTVLVALTELAAERGQGFVLCFDQVDNLTDAQFQALTQFLHTLIDHARNLLVITSGVKSKLLESQRSGIVLSAAWDRVAQEELTLARIAPPHARQIVEARLERAMEPFLAVEEVKACVQREALFPLGLAWWNRRLGDLVEVRPRDVVRWARQRWQWQQDRLAATSGRWLDEWPGDAFVSAADPAESDAPVSLAEDDLQWAIDARIARKIREKIAWRELEPGDLPPDAGHLCGLIETLLTQIWPENLRGEAEISPDCVRGWSVEHVQRVPRRAGGPLPAYDLVVVLVDSSRQIRYRVGLATVATASLTSAAASLRRMAADEGPPDRALLVTEQRQPLRLGARGEEYLASLRARGPGRFAEIALRLEEYAELDALVGVWGDSRSGDLELDLPGGGARAIVEHEVAASFGRQGRYRRHRLLGAILAGPEAASPGADGLAGPDPLHLDAAEATAVRRFVLGQVALCGSITTRDLTGRYREHVLGAVDRRDPERLHAAVRSVVADMHREGTVRAAPEDDQFAVSSG